MSSIEWTEKTWNPSTGCTKISAGCKHCYAETMARRLQAIGVRGYERGFEFTIHPERLHEPMKRRKPTIWFVNSMSDLFHERMPKWFLDRVMSVIESCPQHVFQVLTKRAERMARYFQDRRVPPNLWLGVTVENRRHGVPRIELLRGIPSTVRFLSCEPLLEDLGELDLRGIHWVIVGGESGPKARPMDKEWALRIRDQAKAQGCAFFFKQWGSWGEDGRKRSKTKNGRSLDGRTWDEMPVDAFMCAA
ncbi:MAG: phage Gp37/Gp68 family protein [Deltaproteobacteria bacterium]|nr:MAG: phage Gp37/Gp68 family protein [Deltaproteobacteria bacterium]